LNITLNSLTDPAGNPMDWQPVNFSLQLVSSCTDLLNCLGPGKMDSKFLEMETEEEIIITNPGSFCVSAAPLALQATPPGGTWNGPGITNATNGTFDPATAGAGTH